MTFARNDITFARIILLRANVKITCERRDYVRTWCYYVRTI